MSPHVAAQSAFRVALRVVSGQRPIVSTIIAPMPTITQADLSTWYKDCVLMASSEVPEILALCDRVAVLSKGRLAGVLRREEMNEDAILTLAFKEH